MGHADLRFMTHKSMSQDWPKFDQLSAWPTICLSCFYNRKVEKTLTKNFNEKFQSSWPWPQGHIGGQAGTA